MSVFVQNGPMGAAGRNKAQSEGGQSTAPLIPRDYDD